MFVEVEVKNDTEWGWKQGSYLGFSQDTDLPHIPFSYVQVPID